MALTFSGGLDIQKSNKTPLSSIIALPAPRRTVLDFSGDKNIVFKPLLSPGDPVCKYQRVAERTVGDETVPVYSGISGSVKSFVTDADGRTCGVVIESDGQQKCAELEGYGGNLAELTPEKIIDLVKEAAIPCRGSYGFAYKRLRAATGRIKRLILNCCESEPGQTSRKALISEDLDEVLNGMKIVMRAIDIRNCEIASERDGSGVYGALAAKARKTRLFALRKMKQKFPQDEETALICALNGTQISDADEPERSGCVVFDAETAAAVYRAVVYGIPYCERVVTVDSENLLCPLGTPVSDLLEYCGVRAEKAVKIISGGPLRGRTFKKLDEPIDAETAAVTVIYEGDGRPIPEMTQCNRCGRCVDVCPSRILPYRIAELSKQKKYSKCADFGLAACCECGCCDYVCPAYIPIKKLIRAAKHKKAAPKRDKNEIEKTV